MGTTRALVAACIACALSGCIASIVETQQIGARAGAPRYERAVRNGQQLFVFYCLQRGWARCAPKWSAIDLSGLTWSPLAAAVGSPVRSFVWPPIEDGPRPAIAAESGEEIPIVDVAASTNDMRDPRGSAAYILSTSVGRPLSLYHAKPGWLVVVARDRSEPGAVAYAAAVDPTRPYLTWWAIPARIPLYALTLPIDVAALPVEVLAIWWVAQSLRE